jgi:hypothetical protein
LAVIKKLTSNRRPRRPMAAQNTQIWTARLWIAIELTSAQNGGTARVIP